jgi:hypothetical protein
VDLRGLNKIIAPDAYPLPRQDDITNAIMGHYWLSIFDMLSAYYQRRVHPDDIWKLAASTHRGHEAWAVAPMGLSISVPHQQRYMDKLLRELKWRIACCFIDDTVVFSDTFEDHLRDIDEVLTIFETAGLIVQPYKCFVGYHSLKVLGQLVDRFGLTTTEERAEAILKQTYPTTLSGLEHFLGACGYNRHLVPYYAQVTSPLQALKTRGFKQSPKAGQARKRFAEAFKLPAPTDAQLRSFELIKNIIGGRQTMHHPNFNIPFYWYVDASKEWGYGIAVYQDNPASQAEGRLKQAPVMFLSRELKPAEKSYWPTELEAGALVWAVKKLVHIVEGSKVIAYTDHKASEAIVKITSLHTSSPGKSNLRLANWALLLSQYWHNLDVVYVKGIHNIMADALSRLRRDMIALTEDDKRITELKDELDEIEVQAFTNDVTETIQAQDANVTASLLQLSDEFRERLLSEYDDDTVFKSIIKVIKDHHEANGNKEDELVGRPHSPYKVLLPWDKLLLFYKDPVDERLRLCIPKGLHKEIFTMAHDSLNHYGVSKTYSRLVANYFIPHLLRTLKVFISRCPRCAVNKTLREKPHGLLKPITALPYPFHTITIDFILSLPPSRRFAHGDELFDTAMMVTDKFTKAIKIVPGKGTYTAPDWASRFWQAVYPDWGLPNAIISDRDPKFMSEFWKALFQKSGTKILTSTAYHPQTDGQSEGSN